jgi:hypothetical protein
MVLTPRPFRRFVMAEAERLRYAEIRCKRDRLLDGKRVMSTHSHTKFLQDNPQ